MGEVRWGFVVGRSLPRFDGNFGANRNIVGFSYADNSVFIGEIRFDKAKQKNRVVFLNLLVLVSCLVGQKQSPPFASPYLGRMAIDSQTIHLEEYLVDCMFFGICFCHSTIH